MYCEQSRDYLTAHLHHEMSHAENDRLQRHLAVCAACRTALQEQTAIMRALRQTVPVEPSAEARRALQRRVDKDIHYLRAGRSETPRLAAPPPPPLLGYTPPKALPPASDLPRGLLMQPSGPVIPPVLAAPVSGRMQASPRQEPDLLQVSSVLIWATFVLLLAVGVGVVALSLKPPRAEPDTGRLQRLASRSRMDERHAAQARGRLAESLINTQIQLGNTRVQSGTLVVLPHHDPSTGETFVVAYRPEDIERLKGDPKIDQAVFSAMLESAAKVEVSDGKCMLPRELLEKYIGAEYKLSVLDLDQRIEIWSSSQLEKYRTNAPIEINVSLPARNGLPPIKVTE
ncbi:MAG TPA: zf-HC2 domain-containing protein [Planctomycetota bacterium]|nr:zf-HC2 domain-containing protein [Planctomycetota bacterium]